MVNKVIRNGKVAVLVSHGFGAGWSTWNKSIDQEFLLMDAGLVNLREQNAHDYEVEEYITSALQLDEDDYVSIHGWNNVHFEWIPVGTQFYIHEYDGAEVLRTIDNFPLITA